MRMMWFALATAVGSIRRNWVRGALTAFGVAVGVWSVTLVVALSEGATATIEGSVAKLGQNIVTVRPVSVVRSGARGDSVGRLTEQDALALGREVPGVSAAAAYMKSVGQVVFRQHNETAALIGTTLPFFHVRGWAPEEGKLWTVSEQSVGARVCMLGSTTATDLFGDSDPVGQDVRIGKHLFQVVGVLESKGQGAFGKDEDAVVIMPIRTFKAKFTPGPRGRVHRIVLSAEDISAIGAVKKEVGSLLRQRHRLRDGEQDDVRITTQEEMRRQQEGIVEQLRKLLYYLAGISLLVGGVGVMNIMLASVAERTREIGIRMAIGARKGDILLQFLIESVVLALVGGLTGALFALLTVWGVSAALGWSLAVSWVALFVAVGTSTVVGVVFGFFPAQSAARMDPIHALHRE